MPIRIIAVGKKHESWVAEGISRYQSRLKRPFQCEWVLLPHSPRDNASARQEDSARILSRITTDDVVIVLDETGVNLTSPQISEAITNALGVSKPVVCVIGGAYGVDQSVRARADVVWSLSRLVFPHQLARLLLVEQLYRSQEIAASRPYHHV